MKYVRNEEQNSNMLTCSRLKVYLHRLAQKQSAAEADGKIIGVECF